MRIEQLAVKQGAKITGETINDQFGYSVSISASGDAVVVGARNAKTGTGYVKVYKNISGTWTLQGAKITGEASNDQFGWTVSINSTGDTIVVGAPYANSYRGYAKVYKNISGTWTLQGATITGEANNDQFGYSVSINSTGDTIVVGAPDANASRGYAKVYKNISGTWTLQGTAITGETSGDYFGHSVSISASGDAVVVGAPYANSNTGYVKVYKNISGTWTLQGAKITGEASNEYFGYSVSISATGDTIVVGAYYANSNTGYVKVYKNISGTWTQQGATLTGEAGGDLFGNSVSISASGDTIVVGAYGANSRRGYAKVYK